MTIIIHRDTFKARVKEYLFDHALYIKYKLLVIWSCVEQCLSHEIWIFLQGYVSSMRFKALVTKRNISFWMHCFHNWIFFCYKFDEKNRQLDTQHEYRVIKHSTPCPNNHSCISLLPIGSFRVTFGEATSHPR